MLKALHPRSIKQSWRAHPLRNTALTCLGASFLLCTLGGCILAWLVATLPASRQQPARLIVPSFRTYNVTGKPTISADFIDQVLDYYHSPARGKGRALYDYGVQYGIDPAYALAFFMHESTFGTRGVATVTHSLGNIRARPGQPQYHGFRLYSTWEAGFADWYRLIARQYVERWKLSTVDQIIPVYAPAEDNNNVATYIAAVKLAVDRWRAGIVTV
jgi:hypothetical protein